MPLPPALAARLAKRGIIAKDRRKENDEEEVIAESYDNEDEPEVTKKSITDKTKFMGYPGCPNKVNPYHMCSLFCLSRWGKGKLKPDDRDYKAKYEAMMKKIHLPEHWKEKYDPGCGRHYFWCTRTDKVSWLPPTHSKCRPVEAASVLRQILFPSIFGEREVEEEESDKSENGDKDDMDLESDSEDEELEARRRRDKDRRKKDYDRYRGSSYKDNDPMDPSTYSDTPKGSWSSGLDEVREYTKRSKS
ncbi:PQBP1 [Lepeophtheirus salmonis]|uniref:PQBP1 n=1 Tax=Lepeophtheirus salmonis TaxID=72036 RepID=A0A7R8H2H4_LEPSM|nr:PQBP1 [Lepeophtheirus salmonis]CAF2824465.1 PQBP1 [Lepeophtheirus salmonis]